MLWGRVEWQGGVRWKRKVGLSGEMLGVVNLGVQMSG